MSKTLSLLDALLSKARRLRELNRCQDALPILRRLVSYPGLPKSNLAEAHQLMGEAFLDIRQFRAARKHLRIALRLEPENASAHHVLAIAIESDAETDAAQAGRHYQKAVDLAPEAPAILADAGTYLVQMGRTDKGLELLYRAVERAPEDMEILKSLVDSLSEAGQLDDAQRVLNVARFRFGRDSRFPQLLADAEFRAARARQRQKASESISAAPAPVLLPFLRIAGSRQKPVRSYRRDAGASHSGPHLARIHRQFDAGQAK